ncbi:GNAT family N-acetyltransferase [Lacipirellula limnantheis]|uniref:Mycothiol acetyltransferase n=1 Tax=Lacipirellula limnantheis TaxID=2528024 RepID=A0A517U012_9BACT|nr:GNAT family N-acetyltransferase [Lacipirellula limnantheis]QDT73945.1 Mycothiol acetyltransferase [Lacipirellula limnantheis]
MTRISGHRRSARRLSANGGIIGYADPMPENAPRVMTCPAALRPAALRALHDRLPAEQRTGLVQVLHSLGVQNDAAWDGLLVAAHGDRCAPTTASELAGVAWIQQLPGQTACLWIPPDQGAADTPLLRGAAAFVDQRQIPLAQLVVSDDDGYSTEICQAAGFPQFAKLVYLFVDLGIDARRRELSSLPASPPAIRFLGNAQRDLARLERAVEQTYVGTLDCPALDGIRPLNQVLEGYRSQGRHWPEHWYLVQAEGQDIGALILAEHPGLGNWELIYMGLAAPVRGRGWGASIVRHAIDVAARHGAERLVCAVDAANEPALNVYRRLGFVEWAQRIVYARLCARA